MTGQILIVHTLHFLNKRKTDIYSTLLRLSQRALLFLLLQRLAQAEFYYFSMFWPFGWDFFAQNSGEIEKKTQSMREIYSNRCKWGVASFWYQEKQSLAEFTLPLLLSYSSLSIPSTAVSQGIPMRWVAFMYIDMFWLHSAAAVWMNLPLYENTHGEISETKHSKQNR